MRKALKKGLALLLALALCAGLGFSAMADAIDDYLLWQLLSGGAGSSSEDWDDYGWYDPSYDWSHDYEEDYSNWYLYLYGSGTYAYGDIFDAMLSCNSQMDTSVIQWTYDRNYLSHLGGGVFQVIDADYSNKNLTIRAQYAVGSVERSDTCSITVKGLGSTPTYSTFYVTLDDTSMNMSAGETSYLVATCWGGASPYRYSWSTENSNVVRITSGSSSSRCNLEAVGSGTTRVRVDVSDNRGSFDYAYCSISVYGTTARVTSVSLGSRSLTLPAWSSRNLVASITDSRADYSISWSSSNTNIVTVSGTGVNVTINSQGNAGTATVTATVRDNSTGSTRTDTCSVTVEAEKTATYNPSTTISLGGTTAGTAIYTSLRNQFYSVYGETPTDSATITFSAPNSNIATRFLSNGQSVTTGTSYTMAQYKDMYTVPYSSGTFGTPYTLRYNNKNLTGTINIEVSPATADASIALNSAEPYLFSTATPGGSGVSILGSAIRNALGTGNSNVSWSYLRFQSVSSSIGTLYADSTKRALTPTSNVDGAALSNLYFVPAAPGTFSTSYVAYNSNGGTLAVGYLYIVIPVTGNTAPTVQMTNQSLTVNGVSKVTEIYNINGANYFKLRDIATMLNGTGSQFAVGFDNATSTVTITTGQAYTPVGSEMVVGTDKSTTCVIGSMPIYLNGSLVSPLVFNIGGNNFLQLRDLGSMIGFDVGYDEATRTMLVTSR